MTPLLVVTGPIGVGKSAVLFEVDSLLVAAGSRHATVELEELARCWTPEIGPARRAFVHSNLAAVWSNFAAVGADRLIVSALVEHRSDLEGLSQAVPGAEVTIARLHAPLVVLEQRIRSREAGEAVGGELDGARWWTRHFEQHQPEDFMLATDGRPVHEVAEELLRQANWLA